jgi:hypothetical protein
MNPTPKLRFVERYDLNEDTDSIEKVKVLQQWYAYDIDYPTTKGEWKDVPLENEV